MPIVIAITIGILQISNQSDYHSRMNRISTYIILGLCAFLISGCASDTIKRLEGKPNAFGLADRIAVVADEELWNDRVKDTIDYYYGSAYVILPQPEPIFDIQHVTPLQIKNYEVRRKLRCYLIIANLEDEQALSTKFVKQDIGEENYRRALVDSTFNTKVAKDRWALGQLVIYLWGRDKEELIRNLKSNFAGITKRINKFDERQHEATVYFGGENITAKTKIIKSLGVELRVPQEYVLAISDNTTAWLRKESNKASMNILIHRIKYTNKRQLTKEGLKNLRNNVGKAYVSSSVPDSYMRINDVDLPLFVDPVTLDNKYTLHGRGIWDIVNDFMGGAFVSYLIYDEEEGELILIDGFVHAPGEDKRLFMQQLNHILKTVKV